MLLLLLLVMVAGGLRRRELASIFLRRASILQTNTNTPNATSNTPSIARSSQFPHTPPTRIPSVTCPD